MLNETYNKKGSVSIIDKMGGITINFSKLSIPTFFHKTKINPSIIENELKLKSSVKTELTREDIINLIKTYKKPEIKQLHNKINWTQTMLNHLKGKNLEESIVYRKKDWTVNQHSIQFILCDISYSMRHNEQIIYHLIQETRINQDIILFHNDLICDYYHENFKLTFQGKTSYYNPLSNLLAVIKPYNIQCTIKHISDGEVPIYELDKLSILLKEFKTNKINYVYREVGRNNPSYFYNIVNNNPIEHI